MKKIIIICNIFKNFLYFKFIKISRKISFVRFYKFSSEIVEWKILEYFRIRMYKEF